jgi:hypothetical protein
MATHLTRRGLLAGGMALAACLAMTSCALAPDIETAPERPALVVLVAIDGLPMRQLEALQAQLAPDGFRRFFARGRWYADAHQGHGHTVTAAGHAAMLTGAYPQRTGIIGNEWVDREGAPVYCTGDAAFSYLDNATAPRAGTSPRNLLAPTLGDVLREREPGAKVIGISGKDRGAILPAGHRGTAYMYMSDSGRFASSSYYMAQHPAWVRDFNAARPADRFLGQAWSALRSKADYDGDAPDGSPWQSGAGKGLRLPATMAAQPGPGFYASLLSSPFADQLTLDFARAAVAAEQLGRRGQTDILTVSLSGHDYVNHGYGPESRLSHDHLLQIDLQLQAFFQSLDRAVGAGRYVLVVTADHGFTDTPEWAASHGREGGRVDPAALLKHVNAGLSARIGPARWATKVSASGMLFDEARLAERGLSLADVASLAAELAREVPGIQAAYTAADLRKDLAGDPLQAAMRKSWHPQRSPPLMLVPRAGWLLSSRKVGSQHGAPHRDDSHVPLMFWGPAWIDAGRMPLRAEVVDLAPTLAQLLRIPAPSQSQGQALGLKGGPP